MTFNISHLLIFTLINHAGVANGVTSEEITRLADGYAQQISLWNSAIEGVTTAFSSPHASLYDATTEHDILPVHELADGASPAATAAYQFSTPHEYQHDLLFPSTSSSDDNNEEDEAEQEDVYTDTSNSFDLHLDHSFVYDDDDDTLPAEGPNYDDLYSASKSGLLPTIEEENTILLSEEDDDGSDEDNSYYTSTDTNNSNTNSNNGNSVNSSNSTVDLVMSPVSVNAFSDCSSESTVIAGDRNNTKSDKNDYSNDYMRVSMMPNTDRLALVDGHPGYSHNAGDLYDTVQPSSVATHVGVSEGGSNAHYLKQHHELSCDIMLLDREIASLIQSMQPKLASLIATTPSSLALQDAATPVLNRKHHTHCNDDYESDSQASTPVCTKPNQPCYHSSTSVEHTSQNMSPISKTPRSSTTSQSRHISDAAVKLTYDLSFPITQPEEAEESDNTLIAVSLQIDFTTLQQLQERLSVLISQDQALVSQWMSTAPTATVDTAHFVPAAITDIATQYVTTANVNDLGISAASAPQSRFSSTATTPNAIAKNRHNYDLGPSSATNTPIKIADTSDLSTPMLHRHTLHPATFDTHTSPHISPANTSPTAYSVGHSISSDSTQPLGHHNRQTGHMAINDYGTLGFSPALSSQYSPCIDCTGLDISIELAYTKCNSSDNSINTAHINDLNSAMSHMISSLPHHGRPSDGYDTAIGSNSDDLYDNDMQKDGMGDEGELSLSYQIDPLTSLLEEENGGVYSSPSNNQSFTLDRPSSPVDTDLTPILRALKYRCQLPETDYSYTSQNYDPSYERLRVELRQRTDQCVRLEEELSVLRSKLQLFIEPPSSKDEVADHSVVDDAINTNAVCLADRDHHPLSAPSHAPISPHKNIAHDPIQPVLQADGTLNRGLFSPQRLRYNPTSTTKHTRRSITRFSLPSSSSDSPLTAHPYADGLNNSITSSNSGSGDDNNNKKNTQDAITDLNLTILNGLQQLEGIIMDAFTLTQLSLTPHIESPPSSDLPSTNNSNNNSNNNRPTSTATTTSIDDNLLTTNHHHMLHLINDIRQNYDLFTHENQCLKEEIQTLYMWLERLVKQKNQMMLCTKELQGQCDNYKLNIQILESQYTQQPQQQVLSNKTHTNYNTTPTAAAVHTSDDNDKINTPNAFTTTTNTNTTNTNNTNKNIVTDELIYYKQETDSLKLYITDLQTVIDEERLLNTEYKHRMIELQYLITLLEVRIKSNNNNNKSENTSVFTSTSVSQSQSNHHHTTPPQEGWQSTPHTWQSTPTHTPNHSMTSDTPLSLGGGMDSEEINLINQFECVLEKMKGLADAAASKKKGGPTYTNNVYTHTKSTTGGGSGVRLGQYRDGIEEKGDRLDDLVDNMPTPYVYTSATSATTSATNNNGAFDDNDTQCIVDSNRPFPSLNYRSPCTSAINLKAMLSRERSNRSITTVTPSSTNSPTDGVGCNSPLSPKSKCYTDTGSEYLTNPTSNIPTTHPIALARHQVEQATEALTQLQNELTAAEHSASELERMHTEQTHAVQSMEERYNQLLTTHTPPSPCLSPTASTTSEHDENTPPSNTLPSTTSPTFPPTTSPTTAPLSKDLEYYLNIRSQQALYKQITDLNLTIESSKIQQQYTNNIITTLHTRIYTITADLQKSTDLLNSLLQTNDTSDGTDSPTYNNNSANNSTYSTNTHTTINSNNILNKPNKIALQLQQRLHNINNEIYDEYGYTYTNTTTSNTTSTTPYITQLTSRLDSLHQELDIKSNTIFIIQQENIQYNNRLHMLEEENKRLRNEQCERGVYNTTDNNAYTVVE